MCLIQARKNSRGSLSVSLTAAIAISSIRRVNFLAIASLLLLDGSIFMHHKKFRFKFHPLSLCFLVGISLVGCRDFSEVRKLGDRADVIRDQSTRMANDFYDSCVRRSRIPEARFPGIVSTREADEEQCRDNDLEAKEAIIAVNSVLFTYLANLAKLAGDGSSVVSDENQEALASSVDNLTTTAGQAGVTLPEPFSAVVGQASPILTKIFDAVANDIRRNTIVPVMICTDEAIYNYTQGLEEIAVVVYVNQLGGEALRYDNYYRSLGAPALTEDLMPSEALSSLQLDREFNSAIDSIREKRYFAQEFANYLEETRNTHRAITLIFAENRDLTKLNQETKKQEIVPAKREVFCADYEARSREESLSIQLTPSEARRIANILKNYERTTAPMIKRMKQTDFQEQPLFLHDR